MMRPAVLAVFFAAIVASLALRNLPWNLDDKDQAKQAFTSFEMIGKGHWWFQHTPHGKIATKPPLAGWMSAALSPLGWEVAWRLPGFGCALAMLAMLWRAGHRLGDAPLGGVVAAGAFGLNHFTQRLATLVRTDLLLAFFIFLAGYFVYEHVRTSAPWTRRDRWLLFAVVLASMLTKGPIAYAFLLPGLLVFTWLRGASAWAGWWPWFAPLLVFGAWAGVGCWMSDDFFHQVVLIEFLGRFTVGEAAVHHNQVPWFYLGHVLGKFAPWSALLIALFFVRRQIAANPARLWLVCWAVGGLVFMSLVPSKRADRIFPVIPPLCLLAAALLPRETRWQRAGWLTAALALVITLTAAGLEIAGGYRRDVGALARFGKQAREISAAHPERLALLPCKDEALPLYTRRIDSTRPDEALARWRRGEIEWLILSDRDLEKYRAAFAPYRPAAEVPRLPETDSGYVLIHREG